VELFDGVCFIVPITTEIMSSIDDGMSCPICYKKYPATEIENHANKCIFLNSGENDGTSKKRGGDRKETSPAMKRQKMDCHAGQDRSLQYHSVCKNG
jgi:hypothetical protein